MKKYPFETGQKLKLAFKHWDIPSDVEVIVTKQREDKNCKSGFRISVSWNNKEYYLDSKWFKE